MNNLQTADNKLMQTDAKNFGSCFSGSGCKTFNSYSLTTSKPPQSANIKNNTCVYVWLALSCVSVQDGWTASSQGGRNGSSEAAVRQAGQNGDTFTEWLYIP